MILINILSVKKSEIPKTCHNNMSGAARLQYTQSNYYLQVLEATKVQNVMISIPVNTVQARLGVVYNHKMVNSPILYSIFF